MGIRARFDEQNTTTYVAVIEGRVVGQVMSDEMPVAGRVDENDTRRFLRIFSLFVAPEMRRRGIATALMDRAEEDAACMEGCVLQVETSLVDIREMYERRGYSAYTQSECTAPTDDGRTVAYRSDVMCRWRNA